LGRERGERKVAPGVKSHSPRHSDDSAKGKDAAPALQVEIYRDGHLFGPQPAPAGALVPGIPRKAVLSSRASYGTGDVIDGRSPLGPLVPFCPYCHRIGLLLAEAGVPFETYMIDSRDKAPWFLEAFPAGTTPAMQGSPGGVDTGDWVGGFDEILARAKEQSPKFARVANDDGAIKTAEVSAVCGRLALSQFAGVFAGTENDNGKGLLGGLMGMGGIEVIEGESGTETRKRLIQIALDSYAEVERMVSPLPGHFVGGDKPNQADAFMATMLFFSHNLLESGMSPVPQAPCSVADVGAPSVRTYLERWVARPSWKECYKSTSLYSAPTVMSAAKMAVDMAPDVCNQGRDIAVVMARARRMDPTYLLQVGAYTPIFIPVSDAAADDAPGPDGVPIPNVPRIAVLSARASDGEGDAIDGPSPEGPLMPYCTYCIRLCLVLAEARVPFELVLVDGGAKPQWFTQAYPPAMTPAMQGTPGGVDGGDWVGGFDALLERAAGQSPHVVGAVQVESSSDPYRSLETAWFQPPLNLKCDDILVFQSLLANSNCPATTWPPWRRSAGRCR
jgi:glutathione S-transferase